MRSPRLALVALAGIACQAPASADSWNEPMSFEDAGVQLLPADPSVDVAPPPGVVFQQSLLVPGERATFTVSGVAPGDVVYFGRSSTGVGSGPCLSLPSVCLGLRAPVDLIGVTLADNTGTAEVALRLPPRVPPQYVYTQAVVTGPAGTIATNTLTAQILAGGLDNDADGFCSGNTCADPSAVPGDCADDNADAYPGQTKFFIDPFVDDDGDLSYDYDCDGIEEVVIDDVYACTPSSAAIGFCQSFTPGWLGDSPACGMPGDFGTGCFSFDLGGLFAVCNSVGTDPYVQACR